MAEIELKNLTKRYGPETVLNSVNLTLKEGRIIGLLGPNGSGKTTIIKLLNGLIPPTEGSISVFGNPVGIETKKMISYLPERTYLDPNMNVMDCIRYFKDFYEDFDETKALTLTEKLEINRKKKLKTLSKGTKEKIQLILVMSRKARLYILDEPIAGVDPAGRDYILDTIMNNFESGATLLICTHLISDIERILDDVIFISRGNIILQDSADNVRKQYQGSVDTAFREVFRCL